MSYAHLTSNERYVIAHLTTFKLSMREIARRIGRSASSVSRELKRNGPGHGLVFGMMRVKTCRCTQIQGEALLTSPSLWTL